jgi:CRP/FNR family transcriptional regulator, cyclic AMP receptor protein
MATVSASEADDFMGLLEPDELEDFKRRGRARSFASGSILMHEGQVGDRVMVLLRGRVKIASVTEAGREIVLRFCEPGELVGELSVIDGRPRSSTVSAIEPVEALVVPAGEFESFLDANPRVARVLLRVMSRRFRDADRKRIEFGASDSVGRVAARLVELADRHGDPAEGGGVVITLPLSQEELAGWTGSSRESVARALQALRELGWIETRRRRIKVLDLDALRERAA